MDKTTYITSYCLSRTIKVSHTNLVKFLDRFDDDLPLVAIPASAKGRPRLVRLLTELQVARVMLFMGNKINSVREFKNDLAFALIKGESSFELWNECLSMREKDARQVFEMGPDRVLPYNLEYYEKI